MKRMTVKKQRKVLRGWIKWVPVVAIPFAILFFHTWLNIQTIRADYVLRELDAEAREWADRLNHTGMAETIHQDPAMLAEQAEQMAFVQPSPGQREIIYYDPSVPLVAPEDANFAVAQLDGTTESAPVSSEAQTELGDAPASAPHAPVAVPVVPEVPMTQTPVVATELPVPAVQDVVAAPPAPAAAEVAPATVVTDVVLDLPEAEFSEEVVDLESAMESLESL